MSALRHTAATRRPILRDDVIRLKIALAAFVIVTTALIQTIVDSRPIDKKHDCPHHKQQKRSSAKRPQNQHQLSLPGWCRLFLVPPEHQFRSERKLRANRAYAGSLKLAVE